MTRDVDVLIVGAGHGGLAMSSMLTHAGREHLVLERRETLGGGWQDRWDEFTLVTPNWTSSFPGWEYDGADPDGFMGRDEIAARVARYAEVVRAPVALATELRRLTPLDGGGFRADTSRGAVSARQVVVATGSYHMPRIPPLASHLAGRVTQLHSHEYRNQAALPDGAVLVVGSGQTGLQLAEELFESGRRVYVSVGSAGRIPRRYRGRDIFSWVVELMRDGARFGARLPTVGQLPDPALWFNPMPALSGRAGGHDTNLRRYAANGISLAGRLTGADGERLRSSTSGATRETSGGLSRSRSLLPRAALAALAGVGLARRPRARRPAPGRGDGPGEQECRQRDAGARRSEIAARSAAATSGASCSSCQTSRLSTVTSFIGVVATTVAVRRPPESTAISPKTSPGPSVRITAPSFSTSAVPDVIANIA
jgi:putative flavoprotein involved in K+ transport